MKHIAILKQPFFDMIMCGQKTIESRWSMHQIAPYNKIKKGDTILLKQTGKQATAQAIASQVKFFKLTEQIAEQIRKQYGKQIGVDYFKNWQDVCKKKYCTLIWLSKVEKIKPMQVPKSHGSGWLIMEE